MGHQGREREYNGHNKSIMQQERGVVRPLPCCVSAAGCSLIAANDAIMDFSYGTSFLPDRFLREQTSCTHFLIIRKGKTNGAENISGDPGV